MRKPIRPRVGTRNSSRTQPVPWLTMFSIRPLRRASSCVTTPRKSSGTSIESRSIGSWTTAVDLARHDLRLADRELEALAPHRLDEHGELELAAALHLPGVGALGVEHAHGDVADELLLEPVAHLARGQLRARTARRAASC